LPFVTYRLKQIHTLGAGNSVGEGLPATAQDGQVDMHGGIYGCTSIQALKCNPLPVLFTKYNSGDQIEKNEMGGA